ncbi:MAG: 3'-5' exonuclease [Pirellulales bacterium]|nr:3'-5' exonuclease [Pirellulales bacterium]
MAAPAIRYLAFDVESVADGALVSRLRYPGEKLSPSEAIQKYRAELLAKFDSDFIPHTFQIPLCIAIAKIYADFSLCDLVVLDEPHYRPHVQTEHFWRGWEKYKQPTLVTFNGRGFDVPLLELAAFRYGISLPIWFGGVKSFEQPRNRYNNQAHLDLQEVLTNYGSAKFNGGLNLAANILGKPGKMDVQGDMVQDLYQAGKLAEIAGYCRCDVLDTYFVFLRTRVLVGEISLTQEQRLVQDAQAWLEERQEAQPAYRRYLQNWGDWPNPWAK